jgi:hypothetical protein
MPPGAVKTVRDLIFWQYAKLISESSGFGKTNYGFIMSKFKELQSGKIQWSGSIREYIREREVGNRCVYCGAAGKLSVDHLIPCDKCGPETGDNAVLACQHCNSSKGDKGVYEWYELERRDELPRIVEGKYLKLLYGIHEELGTLDAGRKDIERLCAYCGGKCDKSELTVYCAEGVLNHFRK